MCDFVSGYIISTSINWDPHSCKEQHGVLFPRVVCPIKLMHNSLYSLCADGRHIGCFYCGAIMNNASLKHISGSEFAEYTG
jgi:hypothetical protein